MMLEHIDIFEQNVLNDVPFMVIAVPADIHRMSHVRPQDGIADGNIPRISLIIPAAGVNRDAIVGVAHKYVLDLDIRAGHHIDPVRPAFRAERFEVRNPDLLGLADIDAVMRRIDRCNPLDANPLGEDDAYPAESGKTSEFGQVKNASAAYSDIADGVADHRARDRRSAGYVNRLPRRDAQYHFLQMMHARPEVERMRLSAVCSRSSQQRKKVLGSVDARLDESDARLVRGRRVLLQRIGEQMQVMEPVAVHFHRQLLRAVNRESDLVAVKHEEMSRDSGRMTQSFTVPVLCYLNLNRPEQSNIAMEACRT